MEAFGALGGGGGTMNAGEDIEQVYRQDGGSNGGGLFIESPKASNALQDDYADAIYQRYNPPAAADQGHEKGLGIAASITVRVFLRILNADEVEGVSPSKLTPE